MTVLTPRNPDFKIRVIESFKRQHFMKTLGVEITRVEAGEVQLELAYNNGLSQQHGFFHGGVIGTLADNAGGYAAFSLMAADDSILTVEYKMNIMAPGDGDKLIAIGKVKKAGRTLSVCEVDILIEKEGKQKTCATALCTLMTMAGKLDSPATQK